MKIFSIDKTSFEARIRINKENIGNKLLKYEGGTSVTGGSGIMLTGGASGADMTVHGIPASVPSMQHSSTLFDQFADLGHKALDIFMKNNNVHNAYDASFFSSSLSGAGAFTYSRGMDNIIKAINKKYSK